MNPGAAEALFAYADGLRSTLRGDEVLLHAYRGEDTDFVRLNHGRIRQAGHLRQGTVTTTLIDGARQTSLSHPLQGDDAVNRQRGRAILAALRERLPHLPEDPFLHFDRTPSECHAAKPVDLPATEYMVSVVRRAANGMDLVGLVAAGTVSRGFASSIGHRLWFCSDSFRLDWSAHQAADRAVKMEYAGSDWSDRVVDDKTIAARDDLLRLASRQHPIVPGEYRAYLAPAALREWLVITAWGGFSHKAQHSGQSPLLQMRTEDRRLAPIVRLSEHPGRGLAAPFSDRGFLRPARTPLIDAGRYRASLVSARSGREFDLPVTGEEAPDSLDLVGGQLASEEVLSALGDGIYIGNAWYGNFSDRSRCRITGLTRYACFWVQGGRIVAPVPVMRFDDSLYRVLGEQLVDLTRERELLMDIYSYEGRSTTSYLLPGALVSGLQLTL